MDKQDVAAKLIKLYQKPFDDLVDETATNEDKEQTVKTNLLSYI